MKRLLCLVSGHQRTLVPFTRNRFSCRRCGAGLDRDIPMMPTPRTVAVPPPRWRASDRLRVSGREQSRRGPLISTGTSWLQRRPR
jgi:hypothetical protein